jgi:uncharacterized membrane protein YvbJ
MSVIRCQACGTENPSGATYCVKCARKLDAATQESITRQRAEHTATGIRWSAVITVVLIALVIIAVLALLVTGVI